MVNIKRGLRVPIHIISVGDYYDNIRRAQEMGIPEDKAFYVSAYGEARAEDIRRIMVDQRNKPAYLVGDFTDVEIIDLEYWLDVTRKIS